MLMPALLLIASLQCRDALEPGVPRAPGSPAYVVGSEDTLVASRDAYVAYGVGGNLGSLNYGAVDSLYLGTTERKRIALAFDSAAIRAAVGAGTLDSARIELTIQAQNEGFGSGRTIDVFRLLKPWTELGATWNCGSDSDLSNSEPDCGTSIWYMPTGWTTWATPRSGFFVLQGGQSGLVRVNVTADIQAFLAGASNHGWILKGDETTGGLAAIPSRETGNGPRLVLSVSNAGSPVPAHPPESVPQALWDSLHALANLATDPALGSLPFPRNLVLIYFEPSATLAERQSAIDLIGGTVVGGFRLIGDVEAYYVRIQDDGTTGPLRQAIATLEALPYVVVASQDLPEFESHYLRPKDGQNPRDRVLNPVSANGEIRGLAITRARSPVPAIPPDSVPQAVWDSLYAPGNIATDSLGNSLGFPRNVVLIFFQWSATQAQRQAAIDLIGGTVVGGMRFTGNAGGYYVRIRDDGTTGPLLQAISELLGLPQVKSASPDLPQIQPTYLGPRDGGRLARLEAE